ncbi:MAG: TetR/AcrR family transcriptional regulator [Bacteroidota bacterium]
MVLDNIRSLSPRKKEILEVATRLFSQEGYEGASMRQIADELGIKTASLYSHYNSKEDMLWEIAVRCAREFHNHILPISKEKTSLEERLRKMVRIHAQVIVQNIDASAIFFKEWRHLENKDGQQGRRYQYKLLIDIYEKAYIDILEEGIQQGIFRKVPVRFMTFTLLSSINWIQNWYKPTGKMSLDEIAAEFEEYILNGIKA